MKPNASELIQRLDNMANNPETFSSNEWDIFGMGGMKILNIPHDDLVELAEEVGTPNQPLAVELWDSDRYEAKILSCLFTDPEELTEDLLDEWVPEIQSWIVCEYCCNKVIWKAPFAMKKAAEWSESEDDALISAGFSLTGALAANLPSGAEGELGFFDRALFTARKQASRPGSITPKSISSALKLIGVRNRDWHEAAVETCDEIAAQPSDTAKWVASQALAELMTSGLRKAFSE